MDIKGLYKIDREKDRDRLIATFLDAFREYPKLKPAFPEDRAWQTALEMTVRYYTAYDMELGSAFALDEQIREGIVPVFSEAMKAGEAERRARLKSDTPAFRAVMNRLNAEQQQRWRDIFEEMDKLEAGLNLPAPNIYIDFLGVRTDCQGQGRGSRLLSAVYEYAKEAGYPLMLFTNTGEDIAFYKSRGFREAGTVRSPKYGYVNTYLVKDI